MFTTIMDWVINAINSILPTFSLDQSTLDIIDNAFVFLITLFESAGYFLPLDVFVICLTAMFTFDNFALLMRVGQWVIRLVRG